jgi:HD superfamily phosphohydrolase YqeK
MAEADGRGPDEKDLIIIAGIMHDAGKKSGYSSSDKYSYHDHPIEAVDMIKEHEDRLIKYASVSDLQKIYNMIYFHMGRWTPESMNKDMADFGKLEHLLYYADYLSSRKDLDTPVDNFDVTLEDPEDALRTLETINEGVR